MADELQVPYLGRAYCQQCGLWMANGLCLHGSVQGALDRAYASGRMFGGECEIDRFVMATRG